MLNDKILEFYSELREEIQDYVKSNGPISVNAAFKTLFLSYLTEAGETLVSDCTLVDFKRDSENMRLDGYAFSEYFHSLTLLVSKYQSKGIPEKVKKTEIDKLLRKALKFYKTCQTRTTGSYCTRNAVLGTKNLNSSWRYAPAIRGPAN